MNNSFLRKIASDISDGRNVSRTIGHLALRRFRTPDGENLVAIEQNPNTGSEWAMKARAGQKVVQFKNADNNKYVAVSVDGKITRYNRRS